MTTQIVNTQRWFDGQRLHQVGTITLSGSYATPNGDPLSFADGDVKSSRIPDFVTIHSASGYTFSYAPGTDITDGAMFAFLGGVEHAGAVYTAQALSEPVHYHAIFKMR